jgi:hypothetical protein
MATATKTAKTLQASISNAAGATKTGDAVDLRTAVGDLLVTAIVTNGGTGPTIACDFIIQVSNDNSVWREYCRLTAGVTSSTTYTFCVLVPAPAMYVRSVFTGNTGQAVTVAAEGHDYAEIG